jgi:FkbM family methyltransferase
MIQSDHWDYTRREWQEPPFIDLLKEAFTQKVKTVWDVGACVGGWSSVIQEHWPVDMYAFEPFPDNYEALVDNHIPGTKKLNYGIWYGKKQAKAIWRGSNVGAIFIDEVDTTDNVDTGKVFELRTLEEVDAPKPDLIKFDVEGAEKNIFEHSTLLKKVPQIIVEWHFVGVEDAKEFFGKHLPHKVVSNIQDGMFLLRL